MIQKKISSEEYYKSFIPAPGFILIKKDEGNEMYGNVMIPKSVRERQVIWSSTGIIVAKSLIPPKGDYEKYLTKVYCIGDHVGFNSTHPFSAPFPPHFQMENEDGSKDASVIIHIEDLLGILTVSDEQREEIVKRVLDGDL